MGSESFSTVAAFAMSDLSPVVDRSARQDLDRSQAASHQPEFVRLEAVHRFLFKQLLTCDTDTRSNPQFEIRQFKLTLHPFDGRCADSFRVVECRWHVNLS